MQGVSDGKGGVMERFMKAQKDYICDYCGKPIKKGRIYLFGKGRDPRYRAIHPLEQYRGLSEEQVGIQYYQYRLCTRTDCAGRGQ